MSPVKSVEGFFDAIQQAKAGAADFRTNLFPSLPKLHAWIDHGELSGEFRDGVALFFRNDRDFRHFYFCAASLPALRQALADVPGLKTERVVADLVGNETALGELLAELESAGFRRYAKLQRLARPALDDEEKKDTGNLPAVFAEKTESRAILELIESAFDRFSGQLPTLHEIETAAEERRIFAVRRDGIPAGALFFETQGVASAVRFWAVAEKCRAAGVGSALMRHYLRSQTGIRRFTLWVEAGNHDAIRKYKHYGYAPDGLTDCVLANGLVPR